MGTGRKPNVHPDGKLVCSRCKGTKEYTEFYRNKRSPTGYCVYCKECMKEYQSKTDSSKRARYRKSYYERNKQKYKDRYQRKREELIAYQKGWIKNNSQRVSKWEAAYYSLLENVLRENAYNRWANVLKRKDVERLVPFDELLGCSKEFLLEHFRSQYKDGMTDTNYGSEWEIDHILPICSFDLTDEDQLRKCFHYSNLQPLWIHENQEKGITLPDGSKPYIDLSKRKRKKLSEE